MTRRLLRPLVYLLVLGQVLLSAPVVASVTAGNGVTSEMPCADSMPHAADGKPCPCCPDDTRGVAACLSACAGATTTVSIFVLPLTTADCLSPPAAPRVRLVTLADPPLKPPPIL